MMNKNTNDAIFKNISTIYLQRLKSNLSNDEIKALRNLTKQKDIIIKKADKGNTAVILEKESYIKKMKEL